MSELRSLQRSLKWTLRNIDQEYAKENPNHTYLFNEKIARATLERAIKDAELRETPEYKFRAAMQEHVETVAPFCGFY